MQILFLAGRELTYQRNDVLLRAFRRIAQVEIIKNKHPSRSLLLNSFWIGVNGLTKLLTGKYDLIFVGFYGHLLMLFVGTFARWKKIPILFDVFVSNYDTLVEDRRIISPYSIAARLAAWLDKASCNLADHILLDTQFHVEYFIQKYHLSSKKFSVIPVGCNEEIFSQKEDKESTQSPGTSEVLYYCTYLPLHGADIVVQAANILQTEPIHFHLVGTGQEYARVKELAEGKKNIRFTPFLPLETLRDYISSADICLGGHFGTSEKASRVIPGKIYQILAMSRPLIASDSPANRALLTDYKSALLIPPGDAQALARAVLNLHKNNSLRTVLRQNGLRVYQTKCSEAIITAKLAAIIQNLTQ